MSILQFLRILAAHRMIVLVSLLSCFAMAAIGSQILTPRYQATSRIMIELLKPDPVTGDRMTAQGVKAYIRTQVELIQDYRTAGHVVDQLGWTSDPTIIAEYQRATNGQGTDLRRWAAQRIIDGTQAGLIENSNILEISFTGWSPDSAKQIADLIRTAYIDETLRTKRESAAVTAQWYDKQTRIALKKLTDAEAARSKFARDNGIALQQDNSDLENAKLQALTGQSALASAGTAMSGPSAASMQIAQIDQQITQAATMYGPNHPVLQALQRQRAALSSQSQSVSAGPNPGAIERAFQIQKARVIAERGKVDQLNQMQREIDILRDQYLNTAKRAADLRLQANVGESGLNPLGDAVAPNAPSFPNIPLILGGSLALGLGLGVTTALLVEFLGRRVRSDEDLEYAVGAPVLAVIGDRRKPSGLMLTIKKFLRKRGSGESLAAEI